MKVEEEGSVQGTMGSGSDLQAILEKDPYAHFHVDSLCFDDACLLTAHNNNNNNQVFYPGWADLWQHQQHGLLLRDHIFRVFCKTHPGFNLAVQQDMLVLLPANTEDESQQWMKDESYSLRVKDSYGHPAFSLINKGTGKILKHGKHKGEQVHLMDYNANVRDGKTLELDTWHKADHQLWKVFDTRCIHQERE